MCPENRALDGAQAMDYKNTTLTLKIWPTGGSPHGEEAADAEFGVWTGMAWGPKTRGLLTPS